ncbi:MAG: hypothetical protein ATN36_05685 [Epulopiscium sp. Nele67-Bin005]|nr:MAG: hypothetical protein ATN36_05685 [Epulopiscium sp. Nele67-Bin005]
MRKGMLKQTLKSMFGIITVFIVGFILVTFQTYKPNTNLSELSYSNENKNIVFAPETPNAKTGIIFYSGALVEPLAYGYYANALAQEGYLVVIPNLNLNLAILDINISNKIIQQYPEIENWYVAGHSMGGVAASLFASENIDLVKGLIMLASYPMETVDLTNSNLKVLSIYGELDGLSTIDEIEQSRDNFPENAVFHMIEGANHAQFGMYGEQSGDNEATIDVIAQQEEMIEITLQFLLS